MDQNVSDKIPITLSGNESKFSVFQEASATFLLGGISGIIAKTTIAPFDRAKIIFQTTNRQFGLFQMFSLLRQNATDSGLRSLWRGHSLTLLRTFPYAGLQYTSFDIFKSLLKPKNEENLPPFRRFIAGGLAGATASTVVYPLELFRARMAVSSLSLKQNIKVLNSNFGVFGLIFGLKPTLIGMVPYAGIAFGTFESLKVMKLKSNNSSELKHHERAINGSISGLIAQTLTYPLDIVRRRMQTDGAHENSLVLSRKYTSVVETIKFVYKTEGYRGLYKGVSLNWIKGPIALGISFSVFDYLKTKFKIKL